MSKQDLGVWLHVCINDHLSERIEVKEIKPVTCILISFDPLYFTS